MLSPIYDKNRRGAIAHILALPFPWRGLNTRDRLEKVNREFAQRIDNFVIENSEGSLRNGYSAHATGLPSADVESLMVYSGGGSDKMFAGCDGGVYEVTASGAVGAADISSLTGNEWISTMYSTTSDEYLYMVNGADSARHYDGSSWATPTINNVTSSTLCHVAVHKGRVWFVQKNTLDLWYLAAGAVAGDATKFPLGALCKKGGTLTAVGTWSDDAGDGWDDRLVAITSEGEVLIYAGTDPANDYVLIGIFQTAKPVSKKCFVRLGGDLIIYTRAGPVPCSELIQARSPTDSTFNEFVRADFVDLYVNYGSRFGWECIHHTSRGWLIFNIPVNVGSELAYQYVYNDGAWFRFRFQPALCWAEMAGVIYFGAASGGHYKADDASADGDNGSNIIGDVHWAWSDHGTPVKKRYTAARPHIVADSQPAPAIEMPTDYGGEVPTESPTIPTADAATWDVSLWDQTAWAGSLYVYAQWIGISNVGHVGALRMRFETKAQDTLKIQAVEVAFETGGVL